MGNRRADLNPSEKKTRSLRRRTPGFSSISRGGHTIHKSGLLTSAERTGSAGQDRSALQQISEACHQIDPPVIMIGPCEIFLMLMECFRKLLKVKTQTSKSI